MKNIKKNIQKFFKHIFVTNSDHRLWITATLILVVVFGVYASYEFRGVLPGTSVGSQQQNQPLSQQQTFQLPVTIVYNSKDQDQRNKLEQFLGNLADPTTALKNTTVVPRWLDYTSPDAKPILDQSPLHYIPQIFLDASIKNHPQFKSLSQYLNVATDGSYFIRLAPLQHLVTPTPIAGERVKNDPTKAKVVIMTYDNFMCDDCGTTNDTLKNLLQQYGDKLSVVYRYFAPGDINNAIAQGAECAGDQNKYFEMRDKLFAAHTTMVQKFATIADPQQPDGIDAKAGAQIVRDTLDQQAKSLKLNLKTFDACLDAGTFHAPIEQQTLDDLSYGISNPPTFFINQTFHVGLLSSDEFKTIIEAELKK